MVASIWQDKMAINGYELAKAGMAEVQISKALGISVHTFRKWMENKHIFRIAIKMGRRVYKGKDGKGFSFKDYVYNRLSTKLQDLWDEIDKLDEAKCGVERIQALLADRGVRVRQSLFIQAWVSSLFSVSEAIRKTGINYSTFKRWCKDDIDFMKLVEEIQFHKKNFIEHAQLSLIATGDSPATIQANRTINRDRGYSEKTEVNINVQGQIEHRLTILRIGDLDLPLITRKQILKAIRRRRKLISSKVVNIHPGEAVTKE